MVSDVEDKSGLITVLVVAVGVRKRKVRLDQQHVIVKTSKEETSPFSMAYPNMNRRLEIETVGKVCRVSTSLGQTTEQQRKDGRCLRTKVHHEHRKEIRPVYLIIPLSFCPSRSLPAGPLQV